jgi:hypothetical protein
VNKHLALSVLSFCGGQKALVYEFPTRFIGIQEVIAWLTPDGVFNSCFEGGNCFVLHNRSFVALSFSCDRRKRNTLAKICPLSFPMNTRHFSE